MPVYTINTGIYALQSVCTFGYISLLSIVGERCAVRLRVRLFQCLVEQDIAFFDNHRTGELINRCADSSVCGSVAPSFP